MLIIERVSGSRGRARIHRCGAVECCLALWVARAPEREPLAASARRLQSRMRPGAIQDAAELDRTIPGWPLVVFELFYRLEAEGIEDAVEMLGEQPARELLAHRLAARSSRMQAPPPAGGATEAAAPLAPGRRRRGPWPVPDRTITRLQRAIRGFWHAGFATCWEREHAALLAHSHALARRLSERPGSAIARLSPRVIHDRDRDRITIVTQGDPPRTVCADELERLDLIPSFWLRRRVVVGVAPRRVGVCIGPAAEDPSAGCPPQLAGILAMLGDPCRLQILLACAARARCTQELAAILGLPEPRVSRHLKELKRHGFVVAHRDGRFVLYSAVPEELASVSSHLRDMLGQAVATAGAAT